MRFALFAGALLAAAPVRASSVTNEVSTSSTQATDTNPRGGTVGDSLNASFDAGEVLTINAGAMLTLQGQTPAQERGAFGTSGSAVTLLSLGADFAATDAFTLGLNLEWSPQSTQFTGTQVPVTSTGTLANALLRSRTSQLEAGLDLSYDTAGNSPLAWSFGAGVSTNHLETDQQIIRVRTGTGAAATPQQIRDSCATGRIRCSRALLAALRAQAVTLDSQRLSGSATAVVSQDTDLTLSGDYYVYDQDPAQVGYYSIAAVGRLGNGLPIAPLQFTVRPEVAHRWGAFSAKIWLQGGRYVAGAGQSTGGGGVRLQYKFSKVFRLWVSGSGQRDVDEQGAETKSGTLALGAGYRF